MNEGKTKDSPRYTIYTDGAARGNPGESASGFSIFDASGKEVASSSFYNGIKTNNFAEYTAIIRALEWCEANLKSPECLSQLHPYIWCTLGYLLFFLRSCKPLLPYIGVLLRHL